MRPNLPIPILLLAVSIATSTTAFGQAVVVNPLSAEQQKTLFHLPEGGAVMPLAFYHNLEVVDSQTGQETGQTFEERIGVYGFLDDENDSLPVGFGTVSLDFLGGLPGLSVNCAACHVGELQYQGNRLRILGGPNLADLRGFSQDVYYSIQAALLDPARLLRLLVRMDRLPHETVAVLEALPLIKQGRFSYRPGSRQAAAVLDEVSRCVTQLRHPPSISSSDRTDITTKFFVEVRPPDDLRDFLAVRPAKGAGDNLVNNIALIAAEANYFTAQGRFPLTTREGFGRLDAFGTVRFLLFPQQSTKLPFTAPVSVPYLWGTGRKKMLHWNANTNSTLQRNIIQSLGMGALPAAGGINNVLLPNLYSLETVAEQIAAPQWPESIFGPLDSNLLQRGEQLYTARCASCHDAGQIDSASGLVVYPLFSLRETGTDPNHALNFHQPVGSKPFAQALSEQATQLQNWYFLRRDPKHPVPTATQITWGGGTARLPAAWQDPLAKSLDAKVYAGLPLTGVWATAPYLHNNSVPTLRDLLKPAQDRPQVFRVGHRDYDPVNVGFTQPSDIGTIPNLERFDTQDAGNSNTGHEGPSFGAQGLTADDVEALLEYLKSL